MKNTKHIVAYAALGTYFFVIGTALVLNNWQVKQYNSEIANSAEDIIEWINHDVESGYVDSSRANDYIYSLEQIIKEIE